MRGRRFIHSRLGVAFEAPEGFTLENTSQAVLGASADGSRRLLFDAADTPNGQSLEEVLRSTWNDTIEPGSLRTETINGLPVATALSVGKEWSFRLSAIRIGNTTFRLIMAVRIGRGRSRRDFPAHAGDRPAGSATRKRGISGRSASKSSPPGRATHPKPRRADGCRPAALDRFLLINGLDRNEPLKVGERYKIAIE